MPQQWDQKVYIRGLIQHKWPEHSFAVMAKPNFQVLKSLLVLVTAYSAGGKILRSSQSAPRVTVIAPENRYSWFGSA